MHVNCTLVSVLQCWIENNITNIKGTKLKEKKTDGSSHSRRPIRRYGRYHRPIVSCLRVWCDHNSRGSNEHERIVFRFNLQAADTDGGARVLGVHQRGEGIARSRAGPAFGSGLARRVGVNGSPARIYTPTLAGGDDRGLGAAC